MSNLKISELTDGGALQATDEVLVARAGANYRIAGAAFGGSGPVFRWCSVNWDNYFLADVTVDNYAANVPFTGIVDQDSGNTFSIDGDGNLVASEAGWYVMGVTANAPSPVSVTLDGSSTVQRWFHWSAILGTGELGTQGLDGLVPISAATGAGQIIVTPISTPGYVAADGFVTNGLVVTARCLAGTDTITANAANSMLDGIGIWRVGT